MTVQLDPTIAPCIGSQESPPLRSLPLEEHRAANDAAMWVALGVPEAVAAMRDLDIPTSGGRSVGATVYRPMGVPTLAAGVLFIHGGGFVIGSRRSHDPLVRALANDAECVVLSTDYRLAPEDPFPAAVEDCEAAAYWMLDHAEELGLDPSRIGIAGDSAGGNLAAAVAARLRDRGVALGAQLLIYPVMSGAMDTGSYRECAVDFGLTAADMAWFWDQYAPVASRLDPSASPGLLEHMGGLPPTILISAEADVLRDEAEAYAARLQTAGVEVIAFRALGMPHAFLNCIGLSVAARRYLRMVGRELGSLLDARKVIVGEASATRTASVAAELS